MSSSRRFALSKVRGEYMIWLDCDDWVEPTFLERLHTAITGQHADLAVCDYVEERRDGSHPIHVTERDSVTDYTRDLIHGRTWCVVWNKLIRTDIVRRHGITFDEHLRYREDVPFSISYSLYCRRVAYVSEPLYHYDKTNDQSLTATEGVNTAFNRDRVASLGELERHLRQSGKARELDRDVLWLKFWIKDAFITHVVTRERIDLWRGSFPEVNRRCRENDGGFHLVHWALANGHDRIALLHAAYWQLRHQLKRLVCRTPSSAT